MQQQKREMVTNAEETIPKPSDYDPSAVLSIVYKVNELLETLHFPPEQRNASIWEIIGNKSVSKWMCWLMGSCRMHHWQRQTRGLMSTITNSLVEIITRQKIWKVQDEGDTLDSHKALPFT